MAWVSAFAQVVWMAGLIGAMLFPVADHPHRSLGHWIRAATALTAELEDDGP